VVQIAQQHLQGQPPRLVEVLRLVDDQGVEFEAGRARPGSLSLLSIAEALFLSPSTLWRRAEEFQAQIAGET
jgi:hypothetical protein